MVDGRLSGSHQGPVVSLRELINIVEGKKAVGNNGPWTVEETPFFEASVLATKKIFPDIGAKLHKFLEYKLQDPIRNPYGKHDKPFAGGSPLEGFRDCHLRDDAVLIYKLRGRAILLVKIISHAEMEGRKQLLLAKQLAPFK